MRHVRGFRLPERDDSPIFWPARDNDSARIALWVTESACWLVTGNNRAFGDPYDLIQVYGNDWAPIDNPTNKDNA